MRVTITSAPIDIAGALANTRPPQAAGACASFIGYCRGDGPHGPISWLELEHYPGFTEAEIERLARDIETHFSLLDLLIIHRVGRIMPGDAIVLVAASSSHRAAAFAAVESLMDYLKTDAPFWKREMRVDGVHWIEPTEEDRRRRLSRESSST